MGKYTKYIQPFVRNLDGYMLHCSRGFLHLTSYAFHAPGLSFWFIWIIHTIRINCKQVFPIEIHTRRNVLTYFIMNTHMLFWFMTYMKNLDSFRIYNFYVFYLQWNCLTTAFHSFVRFLPCVKSMTEGFWHVKKVMRSDSSNISSVKMTCCLSV